MSDKKPLILPDPPARDGNPTPARMDALAKCVNVTNLKKKDKEGRPYNFFNWQAKDRFAYVADLVHMLADTMPESMASNRFTGAELRLLADGLTTINPQQITPEQTRLLGSALLNLQARAMLAFEKDQQKLEEAPSRDLGLRVSQALAADAMEHPLARDHFPTLYHFADGIAKSATKREHGEALPSSANPSTWPKQMMVAYKDDRDKLRSNGQGADHEDSPLHHQTALLDMVYQLRWAVAAEKIHGLVSDLSRTSPAASKAELIGKFIRGDNIGGFGGRS